MAKNIYGTDDDPTWRSGDTTTFTNQSNNLANQAGDAGLNTGQIQVQNETAKAEQKAAQSGQNTAAGSSEVAQGAQIDPTVAQDNMPPPLNPSGIAGDNKIQPYKETKGTTVPPSTAITDNTDFIKNATYQDPTQAYLASLFPQGIPQSIQDEIAKSINFQGSSGQPQLNPQYASWKPSEFNRVNPYNQYLPASAPSTDSGLVTAFNDYLNGLKTNINNQGNNTFDQQQYQNYLQNQLAKQGTDLDQQYVQGQNDLATQMSTGQKSISDYINGLQTGLKNYQDKTKDLSNIGNLSDAETQSAAKNAILADQNRSGSEALSALSNGNASNSKLNALSQQAESSAINQARGQASAAQQNDKSGQELLAEGQKAQAKSYKDAGDTISKNQTDTLNKLQQNGTDAQKQLQDAYNNSKSNLSKQEQDFVNKAQDTLKNANVPENSVRDATSAFANTVKSYLDKGNLSSDQKNNLKTQLESIWRIAVGSNPSDIAFSNQIAGTLSPILQSLGENANYNPNS